MKTVTEYLGRLERHDGYNGGRAVLHLVREPGSAKVLAVHAYGWHTYADNLCQALRRSDVIEWWSA